MKYKIKPVPAICFILGLLLFIHGMTKSFWEDELAILADVLDSNSFSEMIRQLKYEVHAPGIYILTYLLNKLSLINEINLRIPSVLAAGLGLLAYAKIAERYLKSYWVLLFTVLTSCLSIFQWHATEFRPHIFLFAFGSWILFYLHEAMISESNAVFFDNLNKALYFFIAGLFFHFAILYTVPVFFIPFFILYRQKILSSSMQLLGRWRIVLFPLLAGLLAAAGYLLKSNLESILWNPDLVKDLPEIFLVNCVGVMDYFPKTILALCFSLILLAVIKKKLAPPLLFILFSFLLSCGLLFILTNFHIPFARPRYSLYLLPIPLLLTLISLAKLNLPKLVQVLFFGVSIAGAYVNYTAPYYQMQPSPKQYLEKAQKLINENPGSRLIVIGNCRNLTYYIRELKFIKNENLLCMNEKNYKAQWPYLLPRKNYVYVYLIMDSESVVKNLNAKVLDGVFRSYLVEPGVSKSEL
jgi:hypothetical protein